MAVKIESDRMVKVSELHNDTSKWVNAAQDGPLFIMRYGSPKAVLIGTDAFEELLDRIQLREELERREKTSKQKITLEEIEKQYGL
jgi:PHD/YefM family antitoxin component YafN of YafNO toxin-antitoxin module